MKRMLMAMITLLGVSFASVSVSAAEISVMEENIYDESNAESSEIVEYNFQFDEPVETFTIMPVPVYEVNPDDYNFGRMSTYAMNDSVYSGNYNSTVITLWNGLLANNVGKDYIAYRASQYEYYIWFGEDFQASGSTFTGTGTYYCLNTYSSAYTLTTGVDSFTIRVGDSYLYTNVSGGYPTLSDERGLLYEQIQTVLLASLLFFGVFKWIFSAR